MIHKSPESFWANLNFGNIAILASALVDSVACRPHPVDCGGWLGWQGSSLYSCLPPRGFESIEKQRKHKKSSRKASAATPEKSEVPMPAAGGAYIYIYPYSQGPGVGALGALPFTDKGTGP